MNTKQLNQKNKLIWNINASEWNLAMGEGGNNWHKELIAPTAEKLLNLSSGSNLMDVGCGNGVFSRRMAQIGVNVCGIDFSYKNIKEAKKYDTKNINYKVLDASIMSDLQKLKKTVSTV